jgi:hypothetical protein
MKALHEDSATRKSHLVANRQLRFPLPLQRSDEESLNDDAA